jgi:phosphoribosylformimino-5-aminoimidazole carboxamide ribonucleotide (ProFAR) isomerase
VAFEVIPAIDVAGGRLARLTAGGPIAIEAFGGDPVAAARACLEAGAAFLHVVDMDLAFSGEARNAGVLRSIVTLGARVQAAGAVVEDREIAGMLDAGSERVVMGSAALEDLAEAGRMIERYGDRLVVGIEVESGRIRARGRRAADLPLRETLAAIHASGAASCLITGVARVSSLAGPEMHALAMAVELGLPAMVAGGIASIDDLVALRDAGAEAAVVGRAALEGRLDLGSAIASVTAR